MPSLSFFKKRKSRDHQSNPRNSVQDDSRPDAAEAQPGPNARELDLAQTTGEPSVAGTGASGHSSGTGALIASPKSPKNVPGEDEKTSARLARRSSTKELIRGFLGHSSRGSRRDLDTGRSSPSWTPSRSAASTPLPEYHPPRSEPEHEHEHEHDPEPGLEHKLGHGLEHEREPDPEPKPVSAIGAAAAAASASATAAETPAQPSPKLRKNPSQRPRPVSAIVATPDTGGSLPSRWKSQRLKRLQSLAFRSREKKDKDKNKTETPQVTVTPATAVSQPDCSFLRVCLSPHATCHLPPTAPIQSRRPAISDHRETQTLASRRQSEPHIPRFYPRLSAHADGDFHSTTQGRGPSRCRRLSFWRVSFLIFSIGPRET